MTLFSKQGTDNRIEEFQFGDLRVDTPIRHIIVEAESAGGVTNHTKYWCLIDKLNKPITLIYIIGNESEKDYDTHCDLWEFLYNKMEMDIPNGRFTALLFRSSEKYEEFNQLDVTLKYFEDLS